VALLELGMKRRRALGPVGLTRPSWDREACWACTARWAGEGGWRGGPRSAQKVE
jgi:hypothetical protein